MSRRTARSASTTGRSKVDLRADLEEPADGDRQRVAIRGGGPRSRIRVLIDVRRVRVEHVEHVKRQQCPAAAEPDVLSYPDIRLVQAIVVHQTGMDDVQELDRRAAGERPTEVEVHAIDRQQLAAHALAGHAREVVAGIRNALPRRAEQDVYLRHAVRRQTLEVRLPSRLAMTELLRPLPQRRVELLEEVERAAPSGEDVHLRMCRDDAALILNDIASAASTLDGHLAQ